MSGDSDVVTSSMVKDLKDIVTCDHKYFVSAYTEMNTRRFSNLMAEKNGRTYL